jgi:hypothetical protein
VLVVQRLGAAVHAPPLPDNGENRSIIAALIRQYCEDIGLHAALQNADDPPSVDQDTLYVLCPPCEGTGAGPTEPCGPGGLSFPHPDVDTLVRALGKKYLEPI